MAKKRNAGRRATAASQSRQKIPAWAWLVGGGVLALLLVGGLFYLGYQGTAIANSIEGAAVLPDAGRGHQEGDIAYTSDVPVGGIHNAEWQNCGIYDQPVRTENAIHSMEHGAVWIAYRPDLPADQVETLRNLVRQEQAGQQQRWVLLAPKPDIEDPIVVTAWRVQLRVENASDERILQFIRKYQQGPFTPEPGATCTFGGIGQPLS
jgi:hypothetical protein